MRNPHLFSYPIIAIWVAVAFLGGVMLHGSYPFMGTPSIASLIGAVAALGLFLFPMGRMFALCLFALLLGLWRFDLTLPTYKPEAVFIGVVYDAGPYDVLVRDQATGVGIAINLRRNVGERIRVTCSQIEQAIPGPKTIFQIRKGAWFDCKGKTRAIHLDQSWWGNALRMLDGWRTVLTQRIQATLPGDSGALLAGTLYGARGLSTTASAEFKMAGMTHLIAVSGSNISIVITLFVPLFLIIGYRRKPAIILAGIAVVSFVVFVGAQASVVRAALMGWLALLARVFGRRASATRLLVIAATIIVFFDPWALSFDAGFALSFLATWGLLSWSRPMQSWVGFIPEFMGLRAAAATTLAATIATFPYSLWAFGAASLIGLLTNLLAVPLVEFAMLWGTVALIAGPVFPWLAYPALGILETMLAIARISDVVPFLRMNWSLPTWALFASYVLLSLGSIWLRCMQYYPQDCPRKIKKVDQKMHLSEVEDMTKDIFPSV
jgi:ComEC/Rec2-related protein